MMTSPQSPRFTARRMASIIGFAIAAFIYMSGFSALGATASGVAGTNEITSSNPVRNQIVQVQPPQIQMVFRDAITDLGKMGLTVVCGSEPIGIGLPQLGADSKTVSFAVTSAFTAGECLISWKLADGSQGSIPFTSQIVSETTIPMTDGTPTDTTLPAVIGEVVVQSAGGGPRVGGLLGLLRIFEYLLVAAIFGGLLTVTLAWPEGIDYGVCLRFFRITWLLAVVTTYLIVAITSMRNSDNTFVGSLNPFGWFGVLNDAAGLIMLLRFALVIGSFWVTFQPARVFEPATQVPAITLITVLMATFAFTRIGQNVAIFTYIFGIAHVLAIGMWLGGLLLLSRAVLNAPGEADLLNAVRGFTRISTILILVSIGTGVMQVYLLDSFNIFSTGHGRLNLLKLVVVAAMAWISLMFKNFTVTRLSKETELTSKMAWRLRRAVSTELLVGILVLGLTSWMVPMQPTQARASGAQPTVPYAFREELKNDRFHVIISLTPSTTGVNAMRIELLEPSRINNFVVKLIPSEIGYAGIAINVPLKRRGAAIVMGDGSFTLPVAGVWSIEINGATTTGELIPLATTINITESTVASTTTVAPDLASTTTLAGG
jgi:putative copper export protein/methionine-rich copper-binding protein CopC